MKVLISSETDKHMLTFHLKNDNAGFVELLRSLVIAVFYTYTQLIFAVI